MTQETRGLPGLELRSNEGGGLPTIVGRPIVFGSMSERLYDYKYGEFREVVRPSFADKLRAGQHDIRALVDHDAGKVIGRSKAGTLRWVVDDRGVKVEIDPPDTSHGRDIVESVRRGDVDGMSFAFRVAEGGDEIREEDGETIRELVEADEIREFSIVAWPAYAATQVSVRSLEQYASRKASQWASVAKWRIDMESQVY